MPSTNGHGPKRAILYARVSTDEQARSGYSLAQQIEALREYAASEGYEVLEEVSDPGQSGASLERPGMDRVRDLVSAGGVFVVLAQDRDRIAREPAYHYLLRREFEEHGTKIRALNDRGDDSPEGELTDGILDQLAKYEKAKIAERTRRGKLRKAREGRVICGATPTYGFHYNETRDGLLINEPEMRVVEKIFDLAANGVAVRAIQTRLYTEGIPAPKGGSLWDDRVLRRLIANDVYRPHSFEEIAALVTPEVAARLASTKEYGIQWFNRKKANVHIITEPDGNGGRRYRKRNYVKLRPREEWIAVPVPAHLPRDLVDRARSALENSKGYERKGLTRGWELRGILRCPCGSGMGTLTSGSKGGPSYHYYTCVRRRKLGKICTCTQKSLAAIDAEATVWGFISDVLQDPKKISAGMETLIEQEKATGPRDTAKEAKALQQKIAECVHKRSAYQDQQAAGLMTLEELGSKLQEVDDARRLAQAELEALMRRQDHIEELEKDREALLKSMAEIVPEALEDLTPQERNKIYRMLRLEVAPFAEGYEVSGAFCSSGLTSPLGQRNETSTGLPRCAGGIGFIASHRFLVCKGSLGVRLERGVPEKGLAFAALARQTTLLVDPARLRKKATRQL
jgi:site-specific DNA recombinase